MRISDGSSAVCSSDLDGWKDEANLIRFPFLREVRVPARTYDRQFMAVDTLGEQVVLAGPAPDPSDRVGDQGPVAVAASVLPLPGSAVTALVDALPGTKIGRASWWARVGQYV